MALQLTIKSSAGYEVQNAYIKISSYVCNGNTVYATLKGYVSKKLANNGADSIEGSEKVFMLTVEYEDGNENTKKQIYNHVKNLEEFINAIDV